MPHNPIKPDASAAARRNGLMTGNGSVVSVCICTLLYGDVDMMMWIQAMPTLGLIVAAKLVAASVLSGRYAA
jgi:hypothetical protein